MASRPIQQSFEPQRTRQPVQHSPVPEGKPRSPLLEFKPAELAPQDQPTPQVGPNPDIASVSTDDLARKQSGLLERVGVQAARLASASQTCSEIGQNARDLQPALDKFSAAIAELKSSIENWALGIPESQENILAQQAETQRLIDEGVREMVQATAYHAEQHANRVIEAVERNAQWVVDNNNQNTERLLRATQGSGDPRQHHGRDQPHPQHNAPRHTDGNRFDDTSLPRQRQETYGFHRESPLERPTGHSGLKNRASTPYVDEILNFTSCGKQRDAPPEIPGHVSKNIASIIDNRVSVPSIADFDGTVGLFTVQEVYEFCQLRSLSRISYVKPWLRLAYPSWNVEVIKKKIILAAQGLQDDDLEGYLVKLAKLLHGDVPLPDEVYKRKTHLGENLEGFCTRLAKELKVTENGDNELTTIGRIKESLIKNEEREIVRDLRLTLVGVKSLDDLFTKVAVVDNMYVQYDKNCRDEPKIAAISASDEGNKNFLNQGRIYNQPHTTLRYDPRSCEACHKEFTPDAPSHTLCNHCIRDEDARRKYLTGRGRDWGRQDRYGGQQRRSQSRGRYPDRQQDRYTTGHSGQGSSGQGSFRDHSRGRQRYNDRGYGRGGYGYQRSFSRGRSRYEHARDTSRDRGTYHRGAHEYPQMSATDDTCDRDSVMAYSIAPSTAEDDYGIFDASMRHEDIFSLVASATEQREKSRIYLEFVAQQTKGWALLDSGATCNSITFDFLRQCGLENKVEREQVTRYARDFMGNPHRIGGEITLTLQLGRLSYTGKFLVLDPKSKFSAILGVPFLNQYGICNLMREHLSNFTGSKTIVPGDSRNF